MLWWENLWHMPPREKEPLLYIYIYTLHRAFSQLYLFAVILSYASSFSTTVGPTMTDDCKDNNYKTAMHLN